MKALAFVLTAALGAAALLAGCKQSEGERCQVDSDCESGLTCVQATFTCVADDNKEKPIDAKLPNDGPVVDAPVDAPVDAHPDAHPDAAIDAP